MVNHLVKGATHYSAGPSWPRQSLRTATDVGPAGAAPAMPALATRFSLGGLPAGRWRMTDLTDGASTSREISSADLARGLPVSLHLAETQDLPPGAAAVGQGREGGRDGGRGE